ncbi:SpoIIIAH-like family protein [Aquibacillus sediminis]|uniref:SpoIIIAH-like family protein n=1 Tax=Aquibacillus sediminis TaxID=2574734 RepID=UPI0011084323|nr:SpoIIIAH-like family protein [Aquibacillus sediminis]
MLKKQTVWLLTMLSLMIVLSVYYMMSPNGGDFAYLNEDVENSDQTVEVEEQEDLDQPIDEEESDGTLGLDEEVEEVTATSSMSSDELFAAIRLEREDERSKLEDKLDDIMASSTASTEEKDEAYQEMKEIESTKTKEYIVEQTLKSENGYPDALVRAEGEDVVVTVKTEEELTRSEANNILKTTSDEFGEVTIEVRYDQIETGQ